MIPVFCDWLKLRFPVAGMDARYTSVLMQYTENLGASNPDWVRNAWVHHTKRPENVDDLYGTSSATSVRVRYSPESGFVDVDGNLGRWGRGDNVWGCGVYGAAWRFLPELLRGSARCTGNIAIRRIDLTANIAFKSASDAYAYLRWATMHRVHRIKPKPYENGVMWVTENWSMKIYDKIFDLKRLKNGSLSERLQSEFGYLLRFELTLRTDELVKLGVDDLSSWQHNDEKMAEIFELKFSPLLREDVQVDIDTESMPARLAAAVDSWRSGRSYPAMVNDGRISRATYYRLRRDLLQYGYDISQPCDVTALNIKPREVEFSFVDAPSWYWRKTA